MPTEAEEAAAPRGTRSERSVTLLALRRFALMSDLSDGLLEQARAASRYRHFRKGEVLLSPEESPTDAMGFLLQGRLQAIGYLPDGNPFGLNLIESGQFFGELAVIDRGPRSASVVALKDSIVILMEGSAARDLIFRNPPVAEAMMRFLSASIRRMTELRALQAIPQARLRVFALLEHLARADGTRLERIIDHPPTHASIAIMVNTSRETVTRALAELQSEGIIGREPSHLVIRHADRLRALLARG